MLDLTIAIPVRNEAAGLPVCLQAIGADFAVKIVVIDSQSSDGTQEIARKYGAEVVNFQWDGRFPKKRNWFLRNHRPSSRWVLFLDADEILSPEFKAALERELPDSEHAGYWLSYSIYFMGERLKGGYPLKKLALFRPDAGEYERIEEDHWSSLDMEVHEHPVLEGTTDSISVPIDHRDFRNITHYIAKHNEYSSWEAARLMKKVQEGGGMRGWTWKQRVKYYLLRNPMAAPVYFLASYVFYAGFRDGLRGFTFALLKASYFTQVHCKIKEIESRPPFAVTESMKAQTKAVKTTLSAIKEESCAVPHEREVV